MPTTRRTWIRYSSPRSALPDQRARLWSIVTNDGEYLGAWTARPEPAEVLVTVRADPVTPEAMEGAIVANSIPAPVQSQLVSGLSEQVTATLVKVIGNAEPGLSPADLGQSIACDIITSAQQIVAKFDIGSLSCCRFEDTELRCFWNWRVLMERRKFSREFKLEAVKLVRERGVAVAHSGMITGKFQLKIVRFPGGTSTPSRYSGPCDP